LWQQASKTIAKNNTWLEMTLQLPEPTDAGYKAHSVVVAKA
jgi:hypothetical protein